MKEEMDVTAKVKKLAKPVPLLAYLAGRFTYLSETEWRVLIEAAKVTRNEVALEPNSLVANGDLLVSTVPAPPADIPSYEILYEDQWLMAINKPAGLRVHGTGRFTRANLIYHLRQHHCESASLVNRLDANTSGVVLIAKDGETLRHCQQQFAQQKVKKEYLATVHGQPSIAGSIALSLREVSGGDAKRRYMTVSRDGVVARTDYRRLENVSEGFSAMMAWPRTGRTHQIRVHLAAIGHPIVGDWQYGHPEDRKAYQLNRHLLHCSKTLITHPTHLTPVEIVAPVPEEFKLQS